MRLFVNKNTETIVKEFNDKTSSYGFHIPPGEYASGTVTNIFLVDEEANAKRTEIINQYLDLFIGNIDKVNFDEGLSNFLSLTLNNYHIQLLSKNGYELIVSEIKNLYIFNKLTTLSCISNPITSEKVSKIYSLLQIRDLKIAEELLENLLLDNPKDIEL